MNQTQVDNFLRCLLQIDDPSYLALHERAALYNNNAPKHDHQQDHDHDHDQDEVVDNIIAGGHSVIFAKATAMVVLFCASALCGTIPFVLDRCFHWTEEHANARSAIVVKCLLYFGGGVLLATTFLHLLPEVREVIEQLQHCNKLPELPFALTELLMCCGFFLMYLIEETIHTFIHQHHEDLIEHDCAASAFERGHSLRNSYLNKDKDTTAKIEGITVIQEEQPEVVTGHNTPPISQELIAHDTMEQQKYDEAQQNIYDMRLRHDHQHHQKKLASSVNNKKPGHNHSHLPNSNNDDADIMASSMRGLFIVLALSLHELFEGMAIGLESTAGSVWFMFGAVSAHKLVLAFCVGVELIVSRTRKSLAVVYVFTFAIVSPLGIGIGILISKDAAEEATPSITSAILQGFACGTLLYVVFFEILSKEHAGLGAYVALIVGFCVMFGLQQLTASAHNHNHDECGHIDMDSKESLPTIVGGNFKTQLQILREASYKLIKNT